MTVGLTTLDPRTDPESGLWVFSREDFARNRFDYKPGEHVVFGGPTQRGKTTLAFQLLQYTATPDLPAYVAVSKPRDPVTQRWGEKLGYRRVTEWPAPKHIREVFGGEKPSGYLIWPKFGDMDSDVERCARVTKALLDDRYTAGVRNKHGILVLDDTMTKSKLMGLDKPMTTHLAMSGAMGLGVWVFVQKPTDSGRASIWAYGAAEHVFLARDPERRNQIRYDEIGGFDSKLVANATNRLKPFQFLYLKRTEQYVCIVGAE